MKIIIQIMVAAAALIIIAGSIVVIGGALLPRQHKVSRSILLRTPPAQVYALIRDFVAAPTWRADVSRVEILKSENGGTRFREYGKHGAVSYEVVSEIPNQRLVTRIVDKDLGYSGSWDYQLSPAEGGTRLTITEDGDVPNVVFRFMSRFVFGHTGTIDKYCRAVAARFGDNARPE